MTKGEGEGEGEYLLTRKESKCLFFGPESFDTETKDALKGKYNLAFGKAFSLQERFESDRSRIETNFLIKKKIHGNLQYYFDV